MAVLGRYLSLGEEGFTPGQLSVVRFATGIAVSLAAFRLRPGLYRPRNVRLLVTRGISGGIVVVLYFLALSRMPAGEAGMIYNLFPAVATVMAVAFLGERPTVHLLLGLAAATAGVLLVLGKGALSVTVGTGAAAAFGAAFFAAVSANVIRGMRGTDNAPTIFFWFCLAGLPVVLPFALDRWPSSPSLWAVALLMGGSSFAAQVLMTEAYGALSVPEAAAWLQLTPIAQALLALALLGETLSPAVLAGIALGVAGVAYGTAFGRKGEDGPRRNGQGEEPPA